jgi:hypothetical protein
MLLLLLLLRQKRTKTSGRRPTLDSQKHTSL